MPQTKTLLVPMYNGCPTTQYNSKNVADLQRLVASRKIRTVIDIGAWWGPWTLEMLSTAENVKCFEANVDIQPLLAENLKEYSNVEIHNVALSSQQGIGYMGPETHSGTYGMKRKIFFGKNYGNKVQTQTLDHYNFKEVDIIKIDVEGHEHDVLMGAIETIKSNKPLIQVEIKKSHKQAVYQLFKELGLKRIYKRFPDQIWSF